VLAPALGSMLNPLFPPESSSLRPGEKAYLHDVKKNYLTHWTSPGRLFVEGGLAIVPMSIPGNMEAMLLETLLSSERNREAKN
jgi:hypothetical protein